MGVVSTGFVRHNTHPLDLVEETVALRDWALDRTARDELLAEVSGRWCSYHLVFHWTDELGALQMTCAFDMRPPRARIAALHELLALLNDRLGIGHFDVGASDGLPAYRHALLLRGCAVSAEQVEDLLDIAVHELDRFYPAFQYVVWGDRAPADALAAVVFDTVGEA